MEYNRFDLVSVLKEKGHWPIPDASGIGLVPILKNHGESLIGCEIGCCLATNIVYFLENLPNLTKLYAIDPYAEYVDGPGSVVSQELLDTIMGIFLENTKPFEDRVEFIRKTSDAAKYEIPDNHLDYVFPYFLSVFN